MAAQPERNYTAAAVAIHHCRSLGSQSNGAELIIYNSIFACNSQMIFFSKNAGGTDYQQLLLHCGKSKIFFFFLL